MVETNSINAISITGDLPNKLATQDIDAIERTLGLATEVPTTTPQNNVGGVPSTVDPAVVPDGIESSGINAFNDRLQTQLRTALEGLEKPVPSSALPGLSAAVNELFKFETTLAQNATTAPQRIVGTEGADLLAGGNGADIVFGLGGDDVVIALNGSDVVRAGNGDDTVVGGGDRDFLFGEDGNDLMYGDSSGQPTFGIEGNDFMDGGNGDDTMFAGGGGDVVQGGNGSDFLFGEAGDDRLDGGAGDDLISSGEGSDNVFGGDGTDVVFGEAGNDTINADAGDDVVFGDDGNDRLFGGLGSDEIVGGLGADELIGGGGNDRLFGDAGNDAIFGVDSAVAAFGFGKGEIDEMTGGRGRDRFVLGQNGQKYYDDGNAANEGRSDYGLIKDFEATGTDKIQLVGNARDYELRAVGGDVPTGVGIFARSGFVGGPVPIDPIPGPVPGPITGPIGPVETTSISLGTGENSAAAREIVPFSGELLGVVANASLDSLNLTNANQFTFVA
jgi:hypothetical protein